MDPETAPGTPPPAPATPAAAADSRPATLQDIAEAEAKKQGIDPRLVHAVAQTESGYNPAAKSPKGAMGIMQLMPATAAKWKVDPADPVQNIRGGVSELKALLDEHKGDVTMALRRYNGSPTASEAATQPYVDKVLSQIKPTAQATPPTPGEDPNAPPPTIPSVGGGRGKGPGAGGPPAAAAPPRVGTPPPESWGAWALRHGKDLASTFDPRTPGGRQTIAGGLGAAGATALVAATAPVSVPLLGLGAATVGVLGAAGGGMLEEAGEQLIGTKPPSGEAALTAGAVQGGQEAVGHALMWPVQIVGRRLVASRVGRYAAEALNQSKSYTLGKLQAALDSSVDLLRTTKGKAREANAQTATSTRQLVTDAASRARQGVQQATAAGEEQVGVAQDLAAHGVSQAEEKAAAGEAAARAPYDQVVGSPPPSAAAAGKATNQVIQEGGAARARNLAGKAVDEAAASGPDVDITRLKAEAQKVIEGQIRPPAESFPRTGPTEVSDQAVTAASGIAPDQVATLRAKAAAGDARSQTVLQRLTEAVASAQGEAGQEALKHPAMGILSRIMNAEDTVPFRDAHLWKVELDNAIRNTRDQSVKSQVAALTQKFAGSIRTALREAGHAPYEKATAAYAEIAPLYTKGLAPRIKKLAVENPEAIVPMLNPGQPTKAKMLVDLLTHQAEAGGDAEGGRAALEAVQSAWVRKKIIDGGIEKLGDRLSKIPSDFQAAFLGDPKAKAVLDNLKLMSTAYKTAVLTGEAGVEAATASGKAGVSTAQALADQGVSAAREAGQQGVQQVRQLRQGTIAQTRQTGAAQVEQAAAGVRPAQQALAAGKKSFASQESELSGSSLGRTMQPGAAERSGADVLRAMALGPHSIWGGLSIIRILHGPTANDLVHWAAASPAGTRLFVSAITSPAPAIALANLVRSSGILQEELAGGDRSGKKPAAAEPGKGPALVGQPPTPPPVAAAGVGTPPPS